MRAEFVYLMYLGGTLVSILVGFFTADIDVSFPLFTLLGLFFVVVGYVVQTELFDKLRGISPSIVTGCGNWSINDKDVYSRQWETDIVDEKGQIVKNEEGERNKSLGRMAIVFPGGINSHSFNPQSSAEYPVLIFPQYLLEPVGRNYHVHAVLDKYDSLYDLPPTIKRQLMKDFPSRVKSHTPIYFGICSNLDGSLTSEQISLVEANRALANQANTYEDMINDLYEKLRQKNNGERGIFQNPLQGGNQ